MHYSAQKTTESLVDLFRKTDIMCLGGMQRERLPEVLPWVPGLM